jgi:hypothetical protein
MVIVPIVQMHNKTFPPGTTAPPWGHIISYLGAFDLILKEIL